MNQAGIGGVGGTSGGTTVISGGLNPVGPHSIIRAITLIGRYADFELHGHRIPMRNFLGEEGKLWFFRTGFKSEVIEAVPIALLMVFALPILADGPLTEHAAKAFPFLRVSSNFIWFMCLFPCILSLGICLLLQKRYVGEISKTATDYLLLGRMSLLLIEVLLFFGGLVWLEQHMTPTVAWWIAKIIFIWDKHLQIDCYYSLMMMKPMMIRKAFLTSGCLMMAATMPFVTVWLGAWIRRIKRERHRRILEA